jgi:hypothetical protein
VGGVYGQMGRGARGEGEDSGGCGSAVMSFPRLAFHWPSRFRALWSLLCRDPAIRPGLESSSTPLIHTSSRATSS